VQEPRLEFQGRLTLVNARQVLEDQQQALRRLMTHKESLGTPIVADLSGLSDVDTSALAVLLQLDREARALAGKPLRIRGATQDLRSLARLSSLDSVLNWE
jgi:ABC-type transporter Mla MlaB component